MISTTRIPTAEEVARHDTISTIKAVNNFSDFLLHIAKIKMFEKQSLTYFEIEQVVYDTLVHTTDEIFREYARSISYGRNTDNTKNM